MSSSDWREGLDEVHCGEDQVDQLDTEERCHHTSQPPDQQVSPEQRVGSDRAVLDSLKGDRNQERDYDGVENHR